MANGFLNLAPAARPALDPGDYRITVSQRTSLEGCRLSPVSLNVSLATEQIAMEPGQVYSTYPPEGARGRYERCLPHIVFHRETLPWERPLPGAGPELDGRRLPWLALLLFSSDEDVQARGMTFRDSRRPAAGVYNPRQDGAARPGLSEYLGLDDDPCRVIDIPADLFRDILPRPEELPFLAHVRTVSRERKVTDPAVKGESFSCLVANRHPRAPLPGEGPVGHQAHVVSLEDYADYLFSADRSAHPLGLARRVRMFSLAGWEFTTEAEEFNFAALAAKIAPDRAGFGKRAPADGNGPLPPELAIPLELGYCPVDHIFREGSRSVSWYRSPLLPRPPWNDQPPPALFQDQLTGFDPETGLLDISLGAAWQLGRLMAFRRPSFAGRLEKWRRANIAKAAGEQNRQALERALKTGTEGENQAAGRRVGPEEIQRLWERLAGRLKDGVGADDPAGQFGRGLPRVAVQPGVSPGTDALQGGSPDPEAPVGKRGGVLTQAELLALFVHGDGDEGGNEY